ncbi:4-(cytidine 5'-diphospho)-2-C-methyl-D-erythritol kinase [Biformimicrobium ophioploci]|uniref:4-diphosphocytidyl-2-C-methyl-D-erythritol kinase n=1 Tax=Biformimicrobium ophioploci TaxID=3036711 RepID=A0ABQ6LWR2_9GAMM|nr:4-(cytidine 5'-diphospho)-2-C-methyl-D-erythritol kinase [Microbulbifer sp. NKW57]GMG86549.1 4-(cytidine 5'-diphospho)-2-C-methyl-D-erythritol kinase [Microbulbifer sp. NKW57]
MPHFDFSLPAPAKLNLFLHILGRRPDGYHELQTLFQLLDFGDEIRFARSDSSDIRLESPLTDVPLEQNLVYRAARLLQEHTGQKKPGAQLQLVKRLPAGGGIGGGSSDAATTLLGLNKLWNLGLHLDTLAELGRQLGADVPVFVRGRTAWAEGVGEQLQAVEMPEDFFLVLTPGCHVSTQAVFTDPRLTRDTAPITLARFHEGHGHNDCQPLVEDLYPEVRETRLWLSQYAPARMTGTGASVFARFDSEQDASQVLARAPDGLRGFVARGVNVSPAHLSLQAQ